MTECNPRFQYRCDYRGLQGTICNSRCINPNRCNKHKTSTSYTQVCVFRDCNTYTKSKHKLCVVHSNRSTSVPAPHTDSVVKDLGNLTIKESETPVAPEAVVVPVVVDKKTQMQEKMKKVREAKTSSKKAAVVVPEEIKKIVAAQVAEDSEDEE